MEARFCVLSDQRCNGDLLHRGQNSVQLFADYSFRMALLHWRDEGSPELRGLFKDRHTG